MSVLSGILKKIPVRDVSSFAERVPVNNENTVKLFRGVTADSQNGISDILDTIKDSNTIPKTYGGGAALGDGTYFSANPSIGKMYADNGRLPYKAVYSTELNKNKFLDLDSDEFSQIARRTANPRDIYDNIPNDYIGLKSGDTYVVMQPGQLGNTRLSQNFSHDTGNWEQYIPVDDMSVGTQEVPVNILNGGSQ